MTIEELKQKMNHVPDHKMYHGRAMTSKTKALKKFKPKGYPDKFTSTREQETE